MLILNRMGAHCQSSPKKKIAGVVPPVLPWLVLYFKLLSTDGAAVEERSLTTVSLALSLLLFSRERARALRSRAKERSLIAHERKSDRSSLKFSLFARGMSACVYLNSFGIFCYLLCFCKKY